MEFLAFIFAIIGLYAFYRIDRLEKHLAQKGIVDQRFVDEKPWDRWK